MSADALLSRLAGVQGRGPTWRAICPAHKSEHKTRTLAVRELPDGRVLLRCFAGCDAGQVVGAVGLQLSDLFPPRVDDDKRPARERQPFSPYDALRLIDREVQLCATLILVCAQHPEQLTAERRSRLMHSASLIRRARQACGLGEAT